MQALVSLRASRSVMQSSVAAVVAALPLKAAIGVPCAADNGVSLCRDGNGCGRDFWIRPPLTSPEEYSKQGEAYRGTGPPEFPREAVSVARLFLLVVDCSASNAR